MMGSVKEASHAQYTPQPVSFSLFESLSCALPERDTCFYPQCLVLTIHLPGTERPGWKHHVCQLFPACCTVFWRLTSLAVDQQCPRATGKVASSILCSGFSLSSLLCECSAEVHQLQALLSQAAQIPARIWCSGTFWLAPVCLWLCYQNHPHWTLLPWASRSGVLKTPCHNTALFQGTLWTVAEQYPDTSHSPSQMKLQVLCKTDQRQLQLLH